MSADSIHSFLDKGDWNPETLKKFVGSSFNEIVNGETPLTKVLKDEKCSPEIVKQLLAYGGDVNAKDLGCCPLMVALRNFRDESIVRTLLESGADVDSVDRSGQSVICCALRYGVPKGVMKLLLDNGCPHRNCRRHSTVLECAIDFPCLGLKDGILELLFEAGADLLSAGTYRKYHIMSAFHFEAEAGMCNTQFPYSLRAYTHPTEDAGEDVLEERHEREVESDEHKQSSCCFALLARAGFGDPKYLRSDFYCAMEDAGMGTREQSSICLALQAKAGIGDIKFLLREGAFFENGACQKHNYPWLCATYYGNKLTADLVRLLEKEKDLQVVDQYGRTPLQRAVSHCRNETEAIRLLLDLSSVHVIDGSNDTLLYLAAGNPHCNLDVLKLLIDRGAKVNAVINKETLPLFAAVQNSHCEWQSRIVEFLLKKGSQSRINTRINFQNSVKRYGVNLNALQIAIRCGSDYTTLEVLLVAGAWIDVKKHSCWTFALKGKPLDCCGRLLVKYAFLQGTITVSEMKKILVSYRPWDENTTHAKLNFVDECQRELQVMESINSHSIPYALRKRGNTFRDFVAKHLSPQIVTSNNNPQENNFDFDRLLKLMRENAFPQFRSVISAKIGKSALETKLHQGLQLYTAKDCIDSPSQKRKINNDCLYKIGNSLTHSDLFNLIIALYVPSSTDCGNAVKNNTNLDKRNLKQQGGSHKRIKFDDKDLI